jgi:hypothetical protein
VVVVAVVVVDQEVLVYTEERQVKRPPLQLQILVVVVVGHGPASP